MKPLFYIYLSVVWFAFGFLVCKIMINKKYKKQIDAFDREIEANLKIIKMHQIQIDNYIKDQDTNPWE